MDKLKIPYPIIVEGKYDKLKLSLVCEGLIIKTDGFGVFKKNEKAALIRALASKTPLIVLTDSDGGGRVIRSHVSSLVPRDKLIQLYIPCALYVAVSARGAVEALRSRKKLLRDKAARQAAKEKAAREKAAPSKTEPPQ